MGNGRPPKSRFRQGFAAVGLACYSVVVMLVTLSPAPLDRGYGRSVNRVLGVLHNHGVPQWFGYDKLEFSANILMFIPIGVLVTFLLPVRAWWLAVLLCPAMSVGIELTQAVALDARVATGRDVAANSFGALLGIVAAVAVTALVHRRDEKVVARALWERGLLHAGEGAAPAHTLRGFD
ncbi:VanZ family protein [Cryobacterium tepidiphilum]|uniref:VanZ family protein n=1 Tax=Cryobacterium tepidiphilum TaxID=2486026 RepID=A0A3M8L2W9_9MICO|nr:VanZ family protein [Cryobacterium tepidiphilum]RNE59082.1 VanZ family protein [Cryobacterium tepidiphilum]